MTSFNVNCFTIQDKDVDTYRMQPAANLKGIAIYAAAYA